MGETLLEKIESMTATAGNVDPASLQSSYAKSGLYFPQFLDGKVMSKHKDGYGGRFVAHVDRWDDEVFGRVLTEMHLAGTEYAFAVPATQFGCDAFSLNPELQKFRPWLHFAEVVDVERSVAYPRPKPTYKGGRIVPTGKTTKVNVSMSDALATLESGELVTLNPESKVCRLGISEDENRYASLGGWWYSVERAFVVGAGRLSGRSEVGVAGFALVNKKTMEPVKDSGEVAARMRYAALGRRFSGARADLRGLQEKAIAVSNIMEEIQRELDELVRRV